MSTQDPRSVPVRDRRKLSASIKRLMELVKNNPRCHSDYITGWSAGMIETVRLDDQRRRWGDGHDVVSKMEDRLDQDAYIAGCYFDQHYGIFMPFSGDSTCRFLAMQNGMTEVGLDAFYHDPTMVEQFFTRSRKQVRRVHLSLLSECAEEEVEVLVQDWRALRRDYVEYLEGLDV
jgi:hypothetical protein